MLILRFRVTFTHIWTLFAFGVGNGLNSWSSTQGSPDESGHQTPVLDSQVTGEDIKCLFMNTVTTDDDPERVSTEATTDSQSESRTNTPQEELIIYNEYEDGRQRPTYTPNIKTSLTVRKKKRRKKRDPQTLTKAFRANSTFGMQEILLRVRKDLDGA